MEMDVFVLLFVVGGVVCGFLGYLVGNTRNQGGLGFALGLLLGPLGILVAALLPRNESLKAQRWQEKQSRKYRTAPFMDQVAEWEAKEKAKQPLPVPPHLKGRQLDE